MKSPNLSNITDRDDKYCKMKSKDLFEKTKNNFFVQKLFDLLTKKKSLNLIKYNKNIQKRINININDYKEFSETYSSIEIEIKPGDNRFYTFINSKEEDKEYYHIFFDNNNEEIKRNFLGKKERIKIIRIIIDYPVKSFESLFFNCGLVETINFKKFFRKNINNMRYMFFGCSSLKELNLSKFNTNNATNMSHIFYN